MSGLQSCVASFRSNERTNEPSVAPGGIPPLESDDADESNAEIQKLEQQLEDFLKNQTALIEELVVILQEMNESISTGTVDASKKKEESNVEQEKKDEEDEKTGQEISELDDNLKTEQSDEVSEKKEDDEKKESDKEKKEGENDNENDDEKKGDEEKRKDSEKKDVEEGKESDTSASETTAPEEKDSTEEKSAKAEPKDDGGGGDEDDFKTVSETDLKFKVTEMNSQLRNWAKRIESIIERCAPTLQPLNIQFIPCMQNKKSPLPCTSSMIFCFRHFKNKVHSLVI